MPTVSRRPVARAISSLVPTPSVAAASSFPSPMRNSPANPPTSSATSGRRVRDARSPIRVTAFAAASMSTPARRYASVTAPPRGRSPGRQPELVFEHELARLLGYLDRVLAVEACPAERGLGGPGRRDH